jgi:hypothetical protein
VRLDGGLFTARTRLQDLSAPAKASQRMRHDTTDPDYEIRLDDPPANPERGASFCRPAKPESRCVPRIVFFDLICGADLVP